MECTMLPRIDPLSDSSSTLIAELRESLIHIDKRDSGGWSPIGLILTVENTYKESHKIWMRARTLHCAHKSFN